MKKLFVFYKNNILYINILIVILLLILINCQFKYNILIYDDYVYSFKLLFSRYPSNIISWISGTLIPVIFQAHPQDIRAGFYPSSIFLSILYLLVCVTFCRSFFLSAEKSLSLLKRNELFFILPLVFLILQFLYYPKLGNEFYIVSTRLHVISIFAEYLFFYVFYYSFLIGLYNTIYKCKNFNKFDIYTSIFISLILGMYNELSNLSAFFCIFIILVGTFIYDKQKLKNKNILFFIVPFIIGILYYYLVLDVSSQMINGLYHKNYSLSVLLSAENIRKFINSYLNTMFIEKLGFYLILIFLAVVNIFLTKKKSLKDNGINLFVISMLGGFLTANIFMILTPDICSVDYLFQRDSNDMCYINLLEFLMLIYAGELYFKNGYKIKSGILITLLIITFIFAQKYDYLYYTYNSYLQNKTYTYKVKGTDSCCIIAEKQRKKFTAYLTEKTLAVYFILGETAILPESLYLQCKDIYADIDEFFPLKWESRYKKNFPHCILTEDDYIYSTYFKKIYKLPFIGVTFKDDKTAIKEAQKRLKLFNDSYEYWNNNENIKFKDIYERYANKNLTVNDINEIEKKYGKSEITKKAKAYIYYKNKDYKNSLKLYKEYIRKHPNDIDANRNILEITEIKKTP